MRIRVSATTHWTMCCPGLVTISLIRWSTPIWERAAAASPPGAMVVSCSMTLTFGCGGLEFVWIGGTGVANGTGCRAVTRKRVVWGKGGSGGGDLGGRG